MIKANDKTVFNFMCLTILDPATSWFEIVESFTMGVQVVWKGRNSRNKYHS